MPRFHGKFKDAQVNAVTALHAGCVLKLYDAPVTGTPLDTPVGTKLAEFLIPNPSHTTSANGAGLADLVDEWYDDQADANGTARTYTISERTVDGSGNNVDTIIKDGTCGLAGSGADLILQDVNILQNRGFRITRYTFQL